MSLILGLISSHQEGHLNGDIRDSSAMRRTAAPAEMEPSHKPKKGRRWHGCCALFLSPAPGWRIPLAEFLIKGTRYGDRSPQNHRMLSSLSRTDALPQGDTTRVPAASCRHVAMQTHGTWAAGVPPSPGTPTAPRPGPHGPAPAASPVQCTAPGPAP